MKRFLEEILKKVSLGTLSPEEALEHLKDYPYQDLSFAKIDHQRELRRGFPEIIYGPGKTTDQITAISREILEKKVNLLITKIEPEIFQKVNQAVPELEYNSLAKAAYVKLLTPPSGKGRIVIITAGTSDIPVAEEAFLTCDILGNEVDKIYDAGVAGIHRLFGEYEKIKKSRVIITAAGMEGALPSVVAGITRSPIIAVPTSIGYGASLKGIAALLAMLNSCSGGVSVVNIDNGFGAGYMASLINHLD